MTEELAPIKQVEYLSNGVRLRGRFFSASQSPKNERLVVVTTGDGTSGSKSGTYRAILPRLLEQKLGVFIFDFAGKGFSEGDNSRMTVQTGIDNLTDSMSVIRAEGWIDQAHIGILGSSYGGLVALCYAGQHPNDFKAIALKSPACFYPEVYERWIGLDGISKWKQNGYDDEIGRYWDAYLEAFDHNVYTAAKQIEVPCLITHGSADTDVPIVQSIRLQACLRGRVELQILEGVSHGYTENNALQTAAGLYAKWFDTLL